MDVNGRFHTLIEPCDSRRRVRRRSFVLWRTSSEPKPLQTVSKLFARIVSEQFDRRIAVIRSILFSDHEFHSFAKRRYLDDYPSILIEEVENLRRGQFISGYASDGGHGFEIRIVAH